MVQREVCSLHADEKRVNAIRFLGVTDRITHPISELNYLKQRPPPPPPSLWLLERIRFPEQDREICNWLNMVNLTWRIIDCLLFQYNNRH